MGLRNRGFVLDYYLPLFAGTDAAKRGRFRTRFPFSLYAPYVTGGGTGTAGGIGGGDGGFGTPIDFSIHTPVITTPDSADHLDLDVCSSITASAFASDNGQTHLASRWMIEAMNFTTAAGGAVSCTQYKVHPSGDGASLPWRSTVSQSLEDWRVANGYATAFFGTNDFRGAGCFTGGPQTIEAGLVQGSPLCGVDGGGTHSAGGNPTYGSRTGLYCTSSESIVPTTPTGSYVYDSGPDALHLTSLSIPSIGLAPFGAYRVMVRYKGSNGGWSDWSVQQVFSLGACADCP